MGDVTASAEPVDELAHVLDLVVGGVEGDAAGGVAEAPGRVEEHHVAAPGEEHGVGGQRPLVLTEAVGADHGGSRMRGVHRRGHVERGVDADVLVIGRPVDDVDEARLRAVPGGGRRCRRRGQEGHREGAEREGRGQPPAGAGATAAHGCQ